MLDCKSAIGVRGKITLKFTDQSKMDDAKQFIQIGAYSESSMKICRYSESTTGHSVRRLYLDDIRFCELHSLRGKIRVSTSLCTCLMDCCARNELD